MIPCTGGLRVAEPPKQLGDRVWSPQPPESSHARTERSNVLIYFDGKSKGRTVQHYFNALLPNGYFFLGHSESLYGINEKFRLVHFPGATAYWKSGEASANAGVK